MVSGSNRCGRSWTIRTKPGWCLLTDYPPPSHGICALYRHSHHAPPRVRVYTDFLAEVFGSKPSWEKKLKIKLP
jgi:DNA-binding transcriptional LysR family regulator